MMEVFAGYSAHCDHEMGRVIDAVKQLPGADNTIFVYIVGDNGASAEGGIEGSINENLFFNGFPEKWEDNLKAIDDLGGPKYFNHFPSAWAHAMCTPLQWTKQIASHFGGTRNPMVVSWPAKIKDRGGLREQFLHTVDIVPTLYEVIGITPPNVLNGTPQKPIEGISFAHTFEDAKAKGRRTTQYFEMGCARGIYQDGWMASTNPVVPWNPTREAYDIDKVKWELYHIDKDFSQATDLAKENPEKLRQMQDLWWVEASKHNVLPLDFRGTERLNAELQGRPTLSGDAKTFTYYPGQLALPNDAAPRVLNKSWSVTADIDVPDKAEGMIVTHGGMVGGYGLYLREGKPTFVYNSLDLDRYTVEGKEALPKGKVKLVVDFAYEGKPGERGKGAAVTLSANGNKVAEGKLARTIPLQISLGEGMDIGMDVGSPVDFTYKLPFQFTGKIEKVTYELKWSLACRGPGVTPGPVSHFSGVIPCERDANSSWSPRAPRSGRRPQHPKPPLRLQPGTRPRRSPKHPGSFRRASSGAPPRRLTRSRGRGTRTARARRSGTPTPTRRARSRTTTPATSPTTTTTGTRRT